MGSMVTDLRRYYIDVSLELILVTTTIAIKSLPLELQLGLCETSSQ